MQTPITPLLDRIVIEKENIKESKSGIVLSTSDNDTGSTYIGTVLAVGEGRRTDDGKVIPISVKVGDKVIYSWGDKVEIENKIYYLVTESSVLGIIK